MLNEKIESRFETIFNHVNEGILIANAQGQIVLTNPKANLMFGYNEDELRGKMVEALIPNEYADRHVEHRNSYMKHPVKRPMGKNITPFGKHKDGSNFPVEISLSYYETGEGMYVIGFIIDITERFEQQEKIKKINAELKLLNETLEKKVGERTLVLKEALTELEQSRDELTRSLEKEKELNEMKSRFISMASHEFRTPLSTILSSASLIGRYNGEDDQSKREKHVDRIKNSVTGLTEILNDFLSLGKLEEGKVVGKFQEQDIVVIIQELITEIQVICKENQTIVLDTKGTCILNTDKNMFRNVMINLISNAIKFSPEGSSIEIGAIQEEGGIHISVRDHGMGIPDEDKKHLFGRFFRGKNAQNIQGTGLGLNIVTKYLELMKGTITFESELEKGTTFHIHFKNDN